MFIHNFKYAFICLLRNRGLIFWTLIFPIVLGTMFNVAFSNVEKSEKFSPVKIDIINDEQFKNNQILKTIYQNLSEENSDEQVLNISYVNLDEAKKDLNNKDITGYLYYKDNDPHVVINSNGLNETIFKFIVDEVNENIKLINKLVTDEVTRLSENGDIAFNYEIIYQEVIEMVNDNEIQINDTSRDNLSYTMIEFYTLIAMTCLYGGLLGMVTINQNLANMSQNGKRVAVSGISKFKLIISSATAAFVMQLIGVALLFIYTIFVLKVDYGSNIPLILLLAFAGSLAGLSLGVVLATALKTSENTKTGIIISVTMLGSFLSGMMGVSMKYIVDKTVPFINMINPTNMITDGFYSLYYYDTLSRYTFNVVSLFIFAFTLFGISVWSLRGQKYDSI